MVFIRDANGFLEQTVSKGERTEHIVGGVPAEAANEELAVGGVAVGDGSDGAEDIEVANGSVLDYLEELFVSEGLDDFASVLDGELVGTGVGVG